MRLIWFNRHRRYHDNLSAYIDGELPPEQVADLEAHLEVCRACRRDLEELRATAQTLRDLPPAAAPRSFALTPEQAGRPAARALAPGLPAVAGGLRLAGAGLALALAVVLVVDLGGSGGGGSESAAGPAALQMGAKSADSFADRASAPLEDGTPAPGANGGAASAGQPAAGGIGSVGEDTAPTPGGLAAIGAPAPAPALAPAAGQDVTNGPAAETPSALSYQPPAAQSGGGTDVLRVVEIGLAAAAAIAVAASFLLARARRRELP